MMNHSMVDPNINSTLLDKTLHEESFEKLGATIMNPPGLKCQEDAQNIADMPLIDKITLGPIEKYQKYNRYPYKMIIHVLIIMMTTLQVLITIQADTNYSRGQTKFLDRTFLTPEGDDDDLTDRRTRNIFSVQDLKVYVANSVKNYYILNDLSLENYEYLKTKHGEIQPVNVDVLKVGHGDNNHMNHHYFQLNSTDLGPFDLPDKDLKSKIFKSPCRLFEQSGEN